MAGVHVPAAPGFNGWTRLRDGSWKTLKIEEITEMAEAIEADRAACGHPGKSGMPDHNTGSTRMAGVDNFGNEYHAVAYTYHCRSGSRWFNPVTRKMEGRSHCTCDGCF